MAVQSMSPQTKLQRIIKRLHSSFLEHDQDANVYPNDINALLNFILNLSNEEVEQILNGSHDDRLV
jgi:hypothetical protein